jgi:hypothetical protein
MTQDLCDFSEEEKHKIWRICGKMVNFFEPFVNLKDEKFTKFQGNAKNYAISANDELCVVASQGNIFMLKNTKNPQLYFKFPLEGSWVMANSVNKNSNLIFTGGLNSHHAQNHRKEKFLW